jgi:hypothetical protein
MLSKTELTGRQAGYVSVAQLYGLDGLFHGDLIVWKSDQMYWVGYLL